MSDRQYMEEYKWMKEHGNSIFQPLNQLKNTKLKYLPGFVEFKVLDKNGAILDTYQIPEGNDAKEACKPINLNEEHYDYLQCITQSHLLLDVDTLFHWQLLKHWRKLQKNV